LSSGEGQGSTFVVGLPLAPVRGEERREHPTSHKRKSLPRRTARMHLARSVRKGRTSS
jgi:hypothetical protein